MRCNYSWGWGLHGGQGSVSLMGEAAGTGETGHIASGPSVLEEEHHTLHAIWIEGPPQQECVAIQPHAHNKHSHQADGLNILSTLIRHLCFSLLSVLQVCLRSLASIMVSLGYWSLGEFQVWT